MNADLSLGQVVGLLIKRLNDLATVTIKMLPNFVVALIVLVLISRLRHPIARLVERAVLKVSGHRHIARLMATLTRLAVIAIGLILALDVLNLDRAVASLLAGVGILGIAFGFASQDIAANFMAGILLHFVHPFRIGDLIKSGEFLGYIEALDLRSTIIRNQQGQRITIPNKNLLGNAIINYTISGVRRVDLPWSLTQVEDLQKAEELAVKAVETLELRNPERPVELFYEKVGEYTIDFEIRFWTEPDQKIFLKARSDAIKAIKLTFEEHGIPMPSPVRVLDFGIVGGTTLREQLAGVRIPLSLPEAKPGKKRAAQEEGPKGEEKAEKSEEQQAEKEEDKSGKEQESREE